MSDPRTVLIALNAVGRLHRAAICRLAAELESWWPPDRSVEECSAELGIHPAQLRRARRAAREAVPLAEEELRRARELGATIVTRRDADYPSPLLDLSLPPPVLTVRGRLPTAPGIAVVGSRTPSPYGIEATRFFASELAAAGLVVVSGFARGIDAAAHSGALAAEDGLTAAVLGCGIAVDYPAGHRGLAARIARRGAVLSELPCDAPPRSWNFPVRNRIIAALGRTTLVVEAATRSGSLITARYALELGRDVCALPGRIFDERALGPNALLRDGAAPALHPRDLVESLLGFQSPPAAPGPPLPPVPGLPGVLLGAIRPGAPATLDALAMASGAPPQKVLGALLDLELSGRVRRLPGPTWSRSP